MAEKVFPVSALQRSFRQYSANNSNTSGPSVSSTLRAAANMSEDEQWVVMQLSQVFPHLSQRVLRAAVSSDSQSELLARHNLLNRCIDSLLNRQGSPISISDSEEDLVSAADVSIEDMSEEVVDLTTYCGLGVGNQGDGPDAAQANVGGARPKKKLLVPGPLIIHDVSSGEEASSEDEDGVLGAPPEQVPLPNRAPTVQEKQSEVVAQVIEMFPDVEPDYARDLVISNWTHPHPLNGCCDYLLEHPDFPRVVAQPSAAAAAAKAQDNTKKDFFREYSGEVSVQYRHQVVQRIQNEYRRISIKDIRSILLFYNFHYAPAKKFMQENILAKLPDAVVNSPQPRANKRRSTGANVGPNASCEVPVTLDDGKRLKRTFTVTLLKSARTKVSSIPRICKELQEEIDFVAERAKQQKEEADHLLALRLNEEQYADAGQMIECGCCYGEVTFEDMVQCYDGHLFCNDCLCNYTREKVFGAGQASLSCMTDGCDSTFPMGQLEKALPQNILKKYQERLEEENINLAGLDDLVRCPSCDYAAILDEGDKVFRCQNPDCMKQTCRHCKEDWADHFGIPCNEVERADDTKFRTSIEEKMTEAKIRTCYQCKASFTKQDGCNKMTCRCGAKMCYVCRKAIKDYDHFCRHARNPGEACTVCKACSLWTSTEEDDERAMEEIQREAKEQKKAEGKDRVADKLGPPPTPNKRPRLGEGQPRVLAMPAGPAPLRPVGGHGQLGAPAAAEPMIPVHHNHHVVLPGNPPVVRVPHRPPHGHHMAPQGNPPHIGVPHLHMQHNGYLAQQAHPPHMQHNGYVAQQARPPHMQHVAQRDGAGPPQHMQHNGHVAQRDGAGPPQHMPANHRAQGQGRLPNLPPQPPAHLDDLLHMRQRIEHVRDRMQDIRHRHQLPPMPPLPHHGQFL